MGRYVKELIIQHFKGCGRRYVACSRSSEEEHLDPELKTQPRLEKYLSYPGGRSWEEFSKQIGVGQRHRNVQEFFFSRKLQMISLLLECRILRVNV